MSIKFEITKQNNIHFGIAAVAAALVGLLYIGKLVGDSFVCGSIFWACKCEA